MVRYVLRPVRPELDAKTKTCLPAKTSFCHLDEQAICVFKNDCCRQDVRVFNHIAESGAPLLSYVAAQTQLILAPVPEQ
jgi:hypothetical protein